MLPRRASPQLMRGSPLVRGPLRVEHGESALDRREMATASRAHSYRARSLAKCRRKRRSRRSRGARARRSISGRQLDAVDRRPARRCMRSATCDCSPAVMLRDPAAPRVGHVVGCGDAVDACHHDERSAEWRRGRLRTRASRGPAPAIRGARPPWRLPAGRGRRRGRPATRRQVVAVARPPTRRSCSSPADQADVGQQRLARQAALVGTVERRSRPAARRLRSRLCSHSASRAAMSPRSRVDVFGFARSSSSIRRCGPSQLEPRTVPDGTPVLLECTHSRSLRWLNPVARAWPRTEYNVVRMLPPPGRRENAT